MRTPRIVLIACLLLSVPGTAQRQTSYVVYGHGLTSCGKWLATPSPDDAAMLQWALGYVTAGGYYSAIVWNAVLDTSPELASAAKTYCAANRGEPFCQSQLVKATDSSAISAWLNQYCQTHPLEDLEDASRSLLEELRR